jgi:hypothetical protein
MQSFLRVSLLERLTDGQIIGDSNDAGQRLSCSDTGMRISWDRFGSPGIAVSSPMPYEGRYG